MLWTNVQVKHTAVVIFPPIYLKVSMLAYSHGTIALNHFILKFSTEPYGLLKPLIRWFQRKEKQKPIEIVRIEKTWNYVSYHLFICAICWQSTLIYHCHTPTARNTVYNRLVYFKFNYCMQVSSCGIFGQPQHRNHQTNSVCFSYFLSCCSEFAHICNARRRWCYCWIRE